MTAREHLTQAETRLREKALLLIVALSLDFLVDVIADGEPLVAIGRGQRALVGETETAIDGDPAKEEW